MTIEVGANKWPYLHKEPKDPDATLDYQLDWADWLAEGVSIVDLDVTATAGVTVDSTSFTATTTTAWLSGGTAGDIALITFRITTDSSPVAQIDDRTVKLRILDR
jgi:hypothetical protein